MSFYTKISEGSFSSLYLILIIYNKDYKVKSKNTVLT